MRTLEEREKIFSYAKEGYSRVLEVQVAQR
jgi:hypothetical protein